MTRKNRGPIELALTLKPGGVRVVNRQAEPDKVRFVRAMMAGTDYAGRCAPSRAYRCELCDSFEATEAGGVCPTCEGDLSDREAADREVPQ